ncbi:MAG TPA: M1 family aminopeptidase [Bacteroidales bacterium]|nr:M1 family aminopeptidase [Bacteroidales bacterium]
MGHWQSIFMAGVFSLAGILMADKSSGNIGDTIHAVKYVIELEEVDMGANTIKANTLVSLTPLVDDLGQIRLELMEPLTVDSVLVEGNLVTAIHAASIIDIPLPFTVNVGDTFEVHVYYHGQPFHESWGGFHYSGQYAFNLGVGISWIPHNLGKAWFPCIDDFTDRAVYEVIATVPGNMTAVGGGELVEVIYNFNGTITYRWWLDKPIPTYLASVAIGEYVLVEDTYNGIESDIPITYYVRPGDSTKVPGSFSRIKDVLAIYENRFGAYDWYRVGYVGTAIGAMEHATNIAYPNFCITGNSQYEDLYAHELSHMWFGDKVTCDKAEEMWINEGWATFCANYYAEVLDGALIFKTNMRSMHADVLYSCHNDEGGYHPLNNIPQDYTYGTSAYDKGATVVQALRAYLGDEVFFPACESFLEDLAFTSVSSYDMEENFTQNTGTDMSGFFENWVYNGGTPHYSIDSFSIVQQMGTAEVTVYVKQKRKGPAFIGDNNIIEVSILSDEFERHTDTMQFSGISGQKKFIVPFYPEGVFLDLEERFMDATIDNYKVISEPDEYTFPSTYVNLEVTDISDSAFIQVTHNYAPADTFAVPVPDLRVSDYRYWSIRGVLPDNFSATARFFYSKSGLDNTLITSATDSIVILYREDAGMEWQAVDFTIVGNWSIGYIYVDNVQMGDYTIGVWDMSVSAEENILPHEQITIDIYPNPSSGSFTFEFNDVGDAQISIYTLKGELVEIIKTDAVDNTMKWEPRHLSPGIYMAVLQDKKGKILGKEKIVYSR